jgi:hypothetical protein
LLPDGFVRNVETWSRKFDKTFFARFKWSISQFCGLLCPLRIAVSSLLDPKPRYPIWNLRVNDSLVIDSVVSCTFFSFKLPQLISMYRPLIISVVVTSHTLFTFRLTAFIVAFHFSIWYESEIISPWCHRWRIQTLVANLGLCTHSVFSPCIYPTLSH